MQGLVLTFPAPDHLNHWIQLAEQRSPRLAAHAAEVEALRTDVERANAGHKPTLDAVVQRSLTDRDSVFNPDSVYRNKQVGVSLNLPLFAGGVSARRHGRRWLP